MALSRVCNGQTRPGLKRSELQTKLRGLGLLSIKYSSGLVSNRGYNRKLP